ncbi:ribonuclease toxin immunity protein CdiI [Paenactinomyces guangxiensis]
MVDYETFYQYLKETSEDYLTRNPHNKDEVEACLKEIKRRFNVAQ